MHEGSRAISKELPPARERGGRGRAGRDTDRDRDGDRNTGTGTAPGRLPAPRCLRGARSPPRERAGGARGALGSLLSPFVFWKLTDPFLGAGCLRSPPLPPPVFFAFCIWGCAWRLLLLVLLIAPGPFLALCGRAV